MSVGRRALSAVSGRATRATARSWVATPGDIDPDIELGSLRTAPITVVADDGLPLHVEVDEADPAPGKGGGSIASPVTAVYIHGYSLNLDCWHYQRAAYAGRLRSVYYDQRSHGRSGRSPEGHATIDQLGRDLMRVLHDITHDDPVVLVGHSMGGMTIMSLAEQFPEVFENGKVAGVALLSTTAGGLDPGRILFPMLPAGLGSGVMGRVIGTLARGHRAVDALRSRGHDLAMTVTDVYAFGSDVPDEMVKFVFSLLDGTPFDVVADFFPAFASLDVWDACPTLAQVPTSIICGTHDKITSIGHSRKLHARIHGSDLLECEGAGHMVIMERHAQVNAELATLLTRAADRAGSR